MATPIQPDWMEHAQSLMTAAIIVIGSLLSCIGLLLSYVIHSATGQLRNFRDDIRQLFSRVETTEKKVARLEGAHEARTAMKLSCLVEEVQK